MTHQRTSNLTFEFLGLTYSLEFARHYKECWKQQKDGTSVKGDSTYPYTTVRLIQHPKDEQGAKIIFRTYTVGCYHKEGKEVMKDGVLQVVGRPFSLEDGRKNALRRMTTGKSLPKNLKTAIWDTYLKRKEVKVQDLEVTPPPTSRPSPSSSFIDVGPDVPGGGAC